MPFYTRRADGLSDEMDKDTAAGGLLKKQCLAATRILTSAIQPMGPVELRAKTKGLDRKSNWAQGRAYDFLDLFQITKCGQL